MLINKDQLSFQKLNTAYAKALRQTSGDVVWVYKEHEQSIYFKKQRIYLSL